MVSNGTGNFLFSGIQEMLIGQEEMISSLVLIITMVFEKKIRNLSITDSVKIVRSKVMLRTNASKFKLHGYPDWYKPGSKGRKNFRLAFNGISYGNDNISAGGSKFDTSLDDISNCVSGSSQMDHNFISALAQQMMKIMKRKQAMRHKRLRILMKSMLILQDHTTKHIVAVGQRIGGLYQLDASSISQEPARSFSSRHPALIARHMPFPVTHQAAEKWLHHMQQALDTTPDIDDDSKTKMMNFRRFDIIQGVAPILF